MEWSVVCMLSAFGMGWVIRGCYIDAEVRRRVKRGTCPEHSWRTSEGSSMLRCAHCGLTGADWIRRVS